VHLVKASFIRAIRPDIHNFLFGNMIELGSTIAHAAVSMELKIGVD